MIMPKQNAGYGDLCETIKHLHEDNSLVHAIRMWPLKDSAHLITGQACMRGVARV